MSDTRLQTRHVVIKHGVEPIETDIVNWMLWETPSDSILLAHAYDGVIWGQIENQQLFVSSGITRNSPPLLGTTLQQARVFSPDQELHVWRDGEQWRWRSITDGQDGSAYASYDEHHVLWGDHAHPTQNGFTELEEGAQGMNHAVPFGAFSKRFDLEEGRVTLKVRHYLVETNTGVNYIAFSRLVGLEWIEAEKMKYA